MQLEREAASVMAFVLQSTKNPAAYFENVPESFVCPAVFFPQPEIVTAGDTLSSYAMQYSWYIKFFAKTTSEAFSMAFDALVDLKRNHNLVPLLDEVGNKLTGAGRFLRLDDPSAKPMEDGAAHLVLTWTTRRHQPDINAIGNR